LVKAYINGPLAYYFFKVNDDWLAINNQHKESLNLLQHHLYIKKSGVRIGKLAGRDLIPDHELALSNIINKDAVLQTELSYDEAILYLRRENLTLNTADKGWSLMNFEGQALGWAKLLPNRLNNYYPKELRILASAPSPLL
jgi:NOL1/NOP2/fmu family ribosome biogenesis protein